MMEKAIAPVNSGFSEEGQKRLTLLRRLIEENETIIKSGVDITDAFLLAFLYGRKFNVERAFETVKTFVHMRKRKYAKFFSRIHPMYLLYVYDQPRFFGVLKHRDSTGSMIVVVRVPDISKLKYMEDIIAANVLMLEESLYIKDATQNGISCVLSGEGIGLKEFKEITPSRVKMALDLCVNSFPFKFNTMHVIRCGTFCEWIMTAVKFFMPRKLRDRIKVHKNQESLFEHVPQSALPNWLGGNHSEEEESEVYDYETQTRSLEKQNYYEDFAKKIAEDLGRD